MRTALLAHAEAPSGEHAVTLAEWAESTGYDLVTREYADLGAPTTPVMGAHRRRPPRALDE